MMNRWSPTSAVILIPNYAKQVDGPDWEPFTWQVDCGNSGNGSPNTFVDVTVTETAVMFNTWQGTQNSPFTNIESWMVGVPYKAYRPKPADGAVGRTF